jgi:hypothetical protein
MFRLSTTVTVQGWASCQLTKLLASPRAVYGRMLLYPQEVFVRQGDSATEAE